MSSIIRRAFFAAAVLAAAAVTIAAPPRAEAARAFHLALSRSEPMKDSTVAAPTQLRLWFTETPTLALSRVTLKGPDGVAAALGKVTLDSAAKSPLVVPVTGTLKPGAYTVSWTTASKDGHAVSGSYGFTVKTGK